MNRSLLVAVLLMTSPAVLGQAFWMSGTIVNVITDARDNGDGTTVYGGCAATLSPSPSTRNALCASDYVQFSCDGYYNKPSVGNTKFQAAQLAYVAGKRVEVNLNPSKITNNSCFAEAVLVKD